MEEFQETVSGQNVLARLEPLLAGRDSLERLLAEMMLSAPGSVAKARCSVGSVVRFAKGLGYRGYGELRIALAGAQAAASTSARVYGELQPDDAPGEIARKLFASHLYCLEDTHRNLGLGALTGLAHAIVQGRSVHIYGSGNSWLVALDAEYKLMRVGLSARALTDSRMQLA